MAPSKKEILIPLIHGTKLYPRDTHDDPWGGGGDFHTKGWGSAPHLKY